MGGIAGLVCPINCANDHAKHVEEMCIFQAHRGPDGRGVLAVGRAYLGATFLHLTTRAATSSQPMQDESGDLCIVSDCSIYNYQELRSTLSRRGHRFRSDSDVEVILRAFEEWRNDCPQRLLGVFAFVIYDRSADKLIFARDHFGAKPLYYTSRNGHLYFASEIKPLLTGASALRPNIDTLREWFMYRSILQDQELIQGINSVPPGHLLEIQHGVVTTHCYYSPLFQVKAAVYSHNVVRPAKAVAADLENVLETSIQDCLTGNVPVATFCSGGLDSSLMTALAARHRDVTAFHIAVVDDPNMDERRHAEEVARLLRVPFFSRVIDRAAFLNALPRVIFVNESPLTHIQTVAFYLGVQLAQEHGTKVLLVGDAADTVLGGNWFRQKVLLHLQDVVGRLPGRLRTALADALSYGLPVRPFYDPAGIEMVDRCVRQGYRVASEEAYQFVTNKTDRAILATKLVHLMEDVSWYLQRGDRLGMAATIEYRTPFLDPRLLDLALNLPWSFQTWGFSQKWILKEVARQFLPRRIVYRRKVPWDLPLQEYLAPFANLGLFADGFCVDTLGLDRRAIATIVQDHARHVSSFFSLVNTELWGRLFLRGQSVEQLEELCRALQYGCP
jgi:asparagine synthase (glutamine-hydrolysing)